MVCIQTLIVLSVADRNDLTLKPLMPIVSGGGIAGAAFKSRLARHLVSAVIGDLLPNFSYNVYTSRFVRAPAQGREVNCHHHLHVVYMNDLCAQTLLSYSSIFFFPHRSLHLGQHPRAMPPWLYMAI